jgi:hypothetical protein
MTNAITHPPSVTEDQVADPSAPTAVVGFWAECRRSA